jgi:hypothetical protein
MRPSPSIVSGVDRDTYLILDDFGRIGCAWRETNVEDTELESVINDLLEGQYSNPVRVIGFNTAEGWSRDVSEDVARELRQRCADQDRELPEFPWGLRGPVREREHVACLLSGSGRTSFARARSALSIPLSNVQQLVIAPSPGNACPLLSLHDPVDASALAAC